jgi:platelet-activating factor acetylhydrolase
MANYVQSDPNLLGFLSAKAHPCHYDTPPAGSFPIVVFSHGLGGSMEVYTLLCQQVASQGYFVVALEHEDGSGSYAQTVDGKPIYYHRPDDSPYSRTKVLNFRTPMLEQRVTEVEKVIEYLQVTGHPGADASLPISLLGHSFGAAAMAMTAQHLEDSKLNSVCMLDPWAFSLTNQVLEKGLSVPLLSILSESWTTNSETKQTLELLANSQRLISLYVPNSVHQSFSDTSCWLPSFVARKMYQRAATEKRHDTIRATAEACVAHIRQTMKDTNSADSIPEGSLRQFSIHPLEPPSQVVTSEPLE